MHGLRLPLAVVTEAFDFVPSYRNLWIIVLPQPFDIMPSTNIRPEMTFWGERGLDLFLWNILSAQNPQS